MAAPPGSARLVGQLTPTTSLAKASRPTADTAAVTTPTSLTMKMVTLASDAVTAGRANSDRALATAGRASGQSTPFATLLAGGAAAPTGEGHSTEPTSGDKKAKVELPPTPPSSALSSNESESDGGASPLHTGLLTPGFQPTGFGKRVVSYSESSECHGETNAVSFLPLALTDEERRTLIAEGYPVPRGLPLTKAEERSLKKIRRKIKNKISAQESRRKKKEYVDALERKVEQLTAESEDMRQLCESLKDANHMLRLQLDQLLKREPWDVDRPPTRMSTPVGRGQAPREEQAAKLRAHETKLEPYDDASLSDELTAIIDEAEEALSDEIDSIVVMEEEFLDMAEEIPIVSEESLLP